MRRRRSSSDLAKAASDCALARLLSGSLSILSPRFKRKSRLLVSCHSQNSSAIFGTESADWDRAGISIKNSTAISLVVISVGLVRFWYHPTLAYRVQTESAEV